MTNYIIGISGSGGGMYGPNNLYHLLKLKYNERVILYETIPNNEVENIKNIINIILEKDNATFTLLGYSMGGTIALTVGLYFANQNIISKIVLLSSQTVGFNNINKIGCPIIFIHSTNDEVIPIKYMYKWIDEFNGKKKVILLNSKHDWLGVNVIRLINLLDL